MQLFLNHKQTLSYLKEVPFKLEKDIQKLFEPNLELIANLKLIKSEFVIKSNRIDTLAFDKESKSFVIVEYKRSQNYSVVDQGVSYLNLMLEYKADFIVEYNETQKENLRRTDVDWSQTKIIFVSPSFTDFQKQSSNFKDLAIELWEIQQFENGIVLIHPIKKSRSAPSIKQVQHNDNSEISKVVKELKVYTEEDHLLGKRNNIIELYEAYKNSILSLSNNIQIDPKKLYITFAQNKIAVADMVVQKGNMKLYINYRRGKLDDPKKIAKKISDQSKWGKGYYLINITDENNLEYIMSLVRQALP